MVDEAVSVVLRTVHVNDAGAAILTFGIVMFCVTVVELEAVQPFIGSVTVTEYGPGADTVFVAVVTPPPQLYVTPMVVDEAVSVVLRTVHVNDAGAAILTLGTVMFCVTVVDAEAVQPLDGSVTVTECGPAADTVFVAVVTPPPQS